MLSNYKTWARRGREEERSAKRKSFLRCDGEIPHRRSFTTSLLQGLRGWMITREQRIIIQISQIIELARVHGDLKWKTQSVFSSKLALSKVT